MKKRDSENYVALNIEKDVESVLNTYEKMDIEELRQEIISLAKIAKDVSVNLYKIFLENSMKDKRFVGLELLLESYGGLKKLCRTKK